MTKKQEWKQITYLRRIIKDRKTPITKKANGSTVGGVILTDETIKPYMEKLAALEAKMNADREKMSTSERMDDKIASLPKEPVLKKQTSKRHPLPKAIRNKIWINAYGELPLHKCSTPWCHNKINCFNYHVGHMKAVANEGTNELTNLIPLCASCNLSMGTMDATQWFVMNKKYCLNGREGTDLVETYIQNHGNSEIHAATDPV